MYSPSCYFNPLHNGKCPYGSQKEYSSATIGTNGSAGDFPLTQQTLQNQLIIALARLMLLFMEKPMQGKVIAVGKGKVTEEAS